MPQSPFEVDKTTDTAPAVTSELPWTGERLVPSQSGQIAAEHLHRYAIACALAPGKDVLDIACGEGYGSALLSRAARRVVGVDIDAETVQHAKRKYGSAQVHFLRGDCRAIPLADASVDLVVSFETLEHIEQQADFLDEVRRVLRPGGRLIISTPDKKNYGDSRESSNPFHVRELSAAEFRDVLARFKHVRMLGQRFAAVSAVLENSTVGERRWGMFTGDYQGSEFSEGLAAPTYWVAVCADAPLPSMPVGLFELKEPVAEGAVQPELFAQLFGDDGRSYREDLSIKQAVVSGAWQTVRFEHVEALRTSQGRLRIDPVNTAGVLEVASIRVIRNADQTVVYGAQSAAAFAAIEVSSNVLAQANDQRLVLLARDADPQLFLPALGPLQGRGSYTLELTFKLETTAGGIVQSYHRLLMSNRELAETLEGLRLRAAQLEAAEVVWTQSRDDLRTALESSRVDCGRLESRLAGERRELETAAAGLRQAVEATRQELDAVRRSLSWKLTAPLRTVQRLSAKQRRSLRKRRAEIRELFVRAAVRLHPTAHLKELRRLTKLVRRSHLLDQEWYRAEYKPLVPKTADPVVHYLRYGIALDCNPNPFFSTRYYLEKNPDVTAAGTNPLVHYILFGWKEGRNPSPAFSVRDYLQANPDVAATGREPLAYYLRWRCSATVEGDHGRVSAASRPPQRDASRESGAHPVSVTFESPRPWHAPIAAVNLIAFYLPQFHPIPENDRWWGEGFTDWRNVAKATPLFEGHYQPQLPGPLGFYDLRLKEVMQRQIELAQQFGIHGFCFYHYWFGGTRLLERPVEQLLADPTLSIPFCLCWANENWTRRWDGWDDNILIAQQHSAEDDIAFIRDLLRYFHDPRYLRIDGKPVLVVYRPQILPDAAATVQRWRAFCKEEGLELYCIAAQTSGEAEAGLVGFDAAVQFPPHNSRLNPIHKAGIAPDFQGKIYDYEEWSRAYLKPSPNNSGYPLFRCVSPGWDNTARRGRQATVFADSTPDKYARWLEAACSDACRAHSPGQRFVFLNAWNEWAEGAHLEPDVRYGYAYLNRTAAVLERISRAELAAPPVRQAPQENGAAEASRSDAGTGVAPPAAAPSRSIAPRSVDARLEDIKLIAFYLPQFHPIPENDRAWGEGFTEWTNVTRAVPLYKGHYQPHLPADLGFYDLRVAETREAQAELARAYGIYGFCYYYYWFDGRRLLQRPLDEVLHSGRPDFPFCICWANEPWSRKWDGSEDDVIARQEYSDGFAERFIREALPILEDRRYIRVDGRPLLVVYRVDHLPNPRQVAETWRRVCREVGVGEICLAAVGAFGMRDPRPFGFEVLVEMPPHDIWSSEGLGGAARIEDKLEDCCPGFACVVRDYAACAAALLAQRTEYPRFRGVMVSWDNTPRRGKTAHIFHNADPAAYEQWLRGVFAVAHEASDPYPPFVFLNAWNEWAEGAHLEPDQRYGHAYLEATAAALTAQIEPATRTQNTDDGPRKARWGEARQEKRLRRRYRQLFEANAADRGQTPRISIVIPVFNGLELTLECLDSLHRHRSRWPYEVLIVDDGSSDLTPRCLSALPGARYLRSDQNRGFVATCNHGAQHARGEFLVFLNNDTVVRDGWLDSLYETFLQWPDAGLVGSKLVLPTGRLQECGSLLYRDGSAANYGRDGDPDDPRYCFVRATDYVSGAAIMIRRDLFFRLGAFDERYAPAYYEDTDLAMRVREAGWQVLVNPHAVVLHREGGTAGTDLTVGIKRYQTINQAKFFERWHDALESYPERDAIPQLRRHGPRILVIDWTIPRPDRDSGSVRMVAILRILREAGFQITFAARDLSFDSHYAPQLERMGIEVLRRDYVGAVRQYLEQWGGCFAYVVISRRDTAKLHLEVVRELCPGATLIFDTVDLHFVRETRERALQSDGGLDDVAERSRKEELAMVRQADVTVVVSAEERALLHAAAPGRKVTVVSNIHEPQPTSRPFQDRTGILFIGYFLHKPNVDGVLWFVREVMPLLAADDGEDFTLHVVGSDPPKEVRALAADRVQIHGFVADVIPLFDACRLSIAPLRYGAGVKGKIGQSLALGVPCVMTSIAAEGMGIVDGASGLIADTPAELARKVRQLYGDAQLWETLRRGGIDLIESSLSIETARRELRDLFGDGAASAMPRMSTEAQSASTLSVGD